MQVYKALMDGSTLVAVKFVQGQSRKEQERFEREVIILKSLRHTNIVQVCSAMPQLIMIMQSLQSPSARY